PHRSYWSILLFLPFTFLFHFFFSHHSAPPQFYSLSLHDALPIWRLGQGLPDRHQRRGPMAPVHGPGRGGKELLQRSVRGHGHQRDRKSTRLNSSHVSISYAVFCLKKKN